MSLSALPEHKRQQEDFVLIRLFHHLLSLIFGFECIQRLGIILIPECLLWSCGWSSPGGLVWVWCGSCSISVCSALFFFMDVRKVQPEMACFLLPARSPPLLCPGVEDDGVREQALVHVHALPALLMWNASAAR